MSLSCLMSRLSIPVSAAKKLRVENVLEKPVVRSSRTISDLNPDELGLIFDHMGAKTCVGISRTCKEFHDHAIKALHRKSQRNKRISNDDKILINASEFLVTNGRRDLFGCTPLRDAAAFASKYELPMTFGEEWNGLKMKYTHEQFVEWLEFIIHDRSDFQPIHPRYLSEDFVLNLWTHDAHVTTRNYIAQPAGKVPTRDVQRTKMNDSFRAVYYLLGHERENQDEEYHRNAVASLTKLFRDGIEEDIHLIGLAIFLYDSYGPNFKDVYEDAVRDNREAGGGCLALSFRRRVFQRFREVIIMSTFWPDFNPYLHTWEMAQQLAREKVQWSATERIMRHLPVQDLFKMRNVCHAWKREASRQMRQRTGQLVLNEHYPNCIIFQEGAQADARSFFAKSAPLLKIIPESLGDVETYPTWQRYKHEQELGDVFPFAQTQACRADVYDDAEIKYMVRNEYMTMRLVGQRSIRKLNSTNIRYFAGQPDYDFVLFYLRRVFPHMQNDIQALVFQPYYRSNWYVNARHWTNIFGQMGMEFDIRYWAHRQDDISLSSFSRTECLSKLRVLLKRMFRRAARMSLWDAYDPRFYNWERAIDPKWLKQTRVMFYRLEDQKRFAPLPGDEFYLYN